MTIRGIVRSIPKWWRMMSGNDSLHVKQDVGKAYSLTDLCGYYNDMTLKLSDKSKTDENGIPVVTLSTGETVYSYVTIAQYALALFDVFMLENDEKHLKYAIKLCDFLLEKQDANGGWSVDLMSPERAYYSAMAQGEIISLMLRVGKYSATDRYLDAVKKAYALLIEDISSGGCAKCTAERIELYECTDHPLILNGSVFALWGIYDYARYFGGEQDKKICELCAKTVSDDLGQYDAGFWSKYSCTDMLASPFYHELHIAQLTVLNEQFPDMNFGEYCDIFRRYGKSRIKKTKAFLIKAKQKLCARDSVSVVG